MSRDSVRYGRVPKRSREKNEESRVSGSETVVGGEQQQQPETTNSLIGAEAGSGGSFGSVFGTVDSGGESATSTNSGPIHISSIRRAGTTTTGDHNHQHLGALPPPMTNLGQLDGGGDPHQVTHLVDDKQLTMYEVILTISQAHHANCAYTEEKTRGLIRKPAIFSLNSYGRSTEEVLSPGGGTGTANSLEEQKIVMWEHFAVLLTPTIQRVVEFAKRAPGFLDLTQDDQLILIKLGFFEIWLIHIARMISSLDNTLTFSDGSYITRQQMELMFDHEFVSAIFSFMISFNNLYLNDTEIGLFGAVVLLQSERSGIYDAKAIDHSQEKLMEALKLQIGRSHQSGDGHLFSTLMMKLPELRSLGSKHGEHLQWFRGNWSRLKLPPLFAEIFDIPKSVEELY